MALTLVGVVFARFLSFAGSGDFLVYWSAGRLFLHGRNPYDADAVRAVVNTVRESSFPFISWNPPWTLALTAPFGLLPFGVARVLWYVLEIGALLWMADAYWRSRARSGFHRDVAWFAAVLFVPVLHALLAGQINLIVAVGLFLFLRAIETRQDGLAGVAVWLIAAKPNLAFLFFFLLLLWCLRERRWKILFASGISLFLPTAAAWIYRPSIAVDYFEGLGATGGLLAWATPTAGMFLGVVTGSSSPWIRILPTAAATIVAALLWRFRWKRTFSWRAGLAPIVFLSLATTPYAWPHDMVVLFPAVLSMLVVFSGDMAARWWIPAGILAVETAAYAHMAHLHNAFYGFWVPWALGGLYVLSVRAGGDPAGPRKPSDLAARVRAGGPWG